jgi:UDP-N-acetylmuramoylalanine--D-glutamate ligase
VAWDESEAARAALTNLLPGEGRGPDPSAELDPGLRRGTLSFADPLTLDLTGFAGVSVSPGVPINKHPIAAHARAQGVPLIGDIELFAQARSELPPHKVVGITGTNGKSTTTALVHHILKTAGVPTTMGGNIGLPILAQDPLPEGGVYVLELSSYQIDLTYSLDCDVAVLLNITPDHLDRYDGSFEAYTASKARLFEMQSPEHAAVIVTDDKTTTHIAARVQSRLVAASAKGWKVSGVSFGWGRANFGPSQNYLFLNGDHVGAPQPEWPSLQGPHNGQNVVAAAAVVEVLGASGNRGGLEFLMDGLRTYPGLPHRMERVRERDGVLFVNDSKATNPDSAAPALAAYPDIHWIVGGLAKTDDLGPCEQHLGHVRGAYTIGEAGPMFARLLSGRVPVTQSQVLEKAVTDAAQAARPGEVVLLSPACASFDQFPDFEARGAMFRAAVEALP